jgi:diguanylate cyclase (GGDEF)-like protein
MAEPPRTPFHWSLQTKILVIVLVCVVVPVGLMGRILLNHNEETLRNKAHEALLNQLFRKTTEVDEWSQRPLQDTSRWAASFVVYEGVTALKAGGDDAIRAQGELTQFLQSVLGDYHTYESLFIVDASGNVLASTRGEELEDWGQKILNQGALDKPVLSPLEWSTALRRPSLLVLQPIKSGVGVVGYLIGRLDLKELESHLGTPVDAETSLFQALAHRDSVRELESQLSNPATDSTASFWLLNEDGRIFAKGGKLLTEPAKGRFPGTLLAPGDIVGRPTEADFPGEGSTVYGVRRTAGPMKAFLAATLPSSAAYKPLRESRSNLLMWGVPALLLVAVVSYLAARNMLRPILLLSEGAKRVSAGDLNVYLPVWGRDEIADLTRAFNEMARRVREGHQSLEEARDELARTNEGLKLANRTLETLAITDGLTGLYNHRHFQDSLEKEIRRSDREGRNLSLLLLDLDHFKLYNDRFGHTEGDAALRRVAGLVMKSIRSTDVAFRYGGEELAVLLPSCTKPQATEVAEKIRLAVGQAAHRPGRFGGRITVSVGVATFPEDGRVARGLVDFADAALYSAKADGRDRVAVAGDSLGRKRGSAS